MKHHSEQIKDIERFEPDSKSGLSEEKVASRKEQGLVNVSTSPTNKSYLQIILGNIFTFFNILMIVIAALLVLIVGPKVATNLMFLILITINLLIGIIQECKSKHTVEKLKLLHDSKSKVIRNGQEIEILPSEIVLDEVVSLYPGDQIPVDGIIIDDGLIEINESLLTGESVPVKKNKGDKVFAGSFIVSGNNYIRADKIGNDTYIQSIEKKAKLSKQPKSRLMIAINKIIRVMAYIAIPLAILVFVNETLQGIQNNSDNIPIFPTYWGQETIMTNSIFYSGVTIAYMIPCGMALLASVAMTTGVIKLSQSQTLAQNLYSVELLSRVNTLCLDKTGTLTDGTMTVESFELLDKSASEDEFKVLMQSYLSAFKAKNQTSTALENYFGKEEVFKISNTIQFSSARKYSCVEFINRGWYALGAPEYLTSDKAILDKVNEHAKNGLRVVVLCQVKGQIKDEEKLPSSRTIIGMVVIRDTIRPEVKPTMEWFKENDVDIKVISGDNIGTVSYIAKQSGIDNWDKCVDMSKISEEDDLEQIVMNNSIFGRVSPDQKADIIAILKKNGRITGVTGDGLNDLLAFKQADCSIALANGAAATKNVANLILLDSNFANMKEAVFQGRRVVNNIQRSSTLFVMKDFLWLFITILPILLGIPHIIQPTIMSLVNIFITGISSVFVALEPDRTRVKGNFFKNVTKSAIISGFYMFIPVLMIMLYAIISQVATTGTFNLELLKTTFENGEIKDFGWVALMSLAVTIAGCVVFFENCRPFTRFRKILFASIIGVIFLVLYLIPEFFIVSGTEVLKECADSKLVNIPIYMIDHMGVNAQFGLYLKMNLEQAIVLLVYALGAYPLYMANKKLIGKLLDKLLFSNREFRDE